MPTCDNADYDWAVFDITNYGCEGIAIYPETEVACNFSGSTFPTAKTGANNGLNPQDEEAITVETGRIYALLVNNFPGVYLCNYTLDFTGSTAQLGTFNQVMGVVNYDVNDDCGDEIEVPANNQKVLITDGNNNLVSYGYTQPDGFYIAYLPIGTYSFNVALDEVMPPFESSCFPEVQQINFSQDTGETISNVNFAISAIEECSQYNIEHSAMFFRRCFTTPSTVHISNLGNTLSELDFILRYPSDQVYPLDATFPFDSLGNNEYLFHVPEIAWFQDLYITIYDTATCENVLNDNVCIEAKLVEPNTCINDANPSLELALTFDSLSNQIVLNNFGDVEMPNYYRLYIGSEIDDAGFMFTMSNDYFVFLQPSESTSYSVFSEDWTAALIDIEGSNESLYISNFLNTSYTDTLIDRGISDEDFACYRVVGSYDPNDKQGFPEGFGELNRIEKDQSIRYRIRFQNTGSDTAFTVVVRDTLNEYLDYNSVIPGASSHPYSFYKENNKLKFRFDNVNLVQQSVSEPGSIGFIDFSVRQKDTNPTSYTIENQAAIYFDFNPPIFTNVQSYAIYPLPLGVADVVEAEMNISPNPSEGNLNLHFTKKWNALEKNIQIIDLSGRIIKSVVTNEKNPTIQLQDIPSGTYFVHVSAKNGLRATSRWTKI